jgi:protoheme IX farnesyltransferase
LTSTASTLALNGATVRDYVELMKPRVMSLVVFSGLVGLLMAPGPIHPLLGFVTILGIALSAGGSAAINMWYDRDIDAVMMRTRYRPLPEGRIDPDAALEFGTTLIFASVLLMALAVNLLAAALVALAAAFYVFVYTIWLKRRTPWNIVIGGAAGAFPPVIGWAAVTGQVGWPALILFAIIFFWTPPHFWALALYRNEDYRRAGVPMLPVCKGARRTKLEMLAYTLILLPLSLLPVWIGMSGWFYGTGALALGVTFIVCAVRVLRDKGFSAARRMFFFSLVYLAALFALMIAEPLARAYL